MSETQSWRNPRTAPNPDSYPNMTAPSWLRSWWPAVLWACVIFIMSTDMFSSAHTSSVIEPILRWLFPSADHAQIDFMHYVIRKCAHFTEYFIFGLFVYRGVRGSRKGWHWTWGLTALFIAAFYSALDEIHQAFVASRTSSPYDSMIDSIGAFVAIAVIWMWYRRSNRTPAVPEATSV